MNLIMKKLFFIVCALCVVYSAFAEVECKTIAEIKSQPNKTEILYTGEAMTTFYNGTSNGLFIEDSTGGVLIYGYSQSSKASDHVIAGMKITNIKATWEPQESGKAARIKIATQDKKLPIINAKDLEVEPTRVTMAEFFADKAFYEGKAIVITDAKISPKVNSKYYLTYDGDSVVFHSTNISSYAPAGGEMAGVYCGFDYNRFVLCAPEFIKATEFYSFSDMSTYYKGKNYEIVDAEVGGAVLVNYVAKVDETKTAIFAQYMGLTGVLNNGVVIFVNGETTIEVGDSIDGFYGKYTDGYKDASYPYDYADFKGAYFNQAENKSLNIRNSDNPEIVNADVNITDLKTSKLAFNYASQIITSRYAGKLYSAGDKYYFQVLYEQSKGDDESDSGSMEMVVDSIRVIGDNGLDLSNYVASDVIISGVYDANVIYDEPTIIVRDESDIRQKYYEYATIEELHIAGEPLSKNIVYGLTGEVVVNYKRTQKNSGISQTWVFVEDETGVIALDLGEKTFSPKAGDKIKGLKGTYDDGVRYDYDRTHAPVFVLADDAIIEVVSSGNELNVVKATLGEVIQDTMKYCSRIVDITNFVGTSKTIVDADGSREDYYLYDKTTPSLEMHYEPALHTGDAIIGDNYILRCLVNFNCLSGYYVVYRISVTEDPDATVGVESISDILAKIYSVDGTLYVESEAGQSIDVYTMEGQLLYSTANSSNMIKIDNLSGVVIVKVDNVFYKTIINF